jgi:hypothetical protein
MVANYTTGLTGPVLVNGMNTAANALSSNIATDTGAMTTSVDNTVTNMGDQVTNAINAQISPLPPLIATSTSNIQNTVTTTEQQSVTDFQGMLTNLGISLFVPPASDQTQLTNTVNQFINWGPYSFIQSCQIAFNPAPGDGTLGDGQIFGVPNYEVNTTGQTIYVASVGGANPAGQNVQIVTPGQWYTSGSAVPFNFSQITNLPGWPTFRLFEGAGVWMGFIALVFRYVTPTTEF